MADSLSRRFRLKDFVGDCMAKYRTRLEIVADILRVVSGGARKTHIMYKCNLSYALLNRYLEEVLDSRLVRKDDGNGLYVVTGKGRRFLQRLKRYLEESKTLHEHVENAREEKVRLENMFSKGS
jgi:predicted transcriptional regulator